MRVCSIRPVEAERSDLSTKAQSRRHTLDLLKTGFHRSMCVALHNDDTVTAFDDAGESGVKHGVRSVA